MENIKQIDKYYQKLEIDVILKRLSSLAITPYIQEKILNLEPSSDLDYLDLELKDVEEAALIARRFERANIIVDSDFDEILHRALIGGILSPLEIYEIIKLDATIKANRRLLATLNKEKILVNNFQNLVESFVDTDDLTSKVQETVEYDGTILDTASFLLKQIRSKLKGMDQRIKQKINEIMAKESSKLSETFVAIRDNHYCLPVRAEYKNSIKGIVHDTSASMQTFYIEPLGIVDLTLQKEKLNNEEKEEVNRILKIISKMIGEHYDLLSSNFQIIKRLDFIFAKAILANEMDAIKPVLTNKHQLNLLKARHPLLNVERVIPNDISFGNNYQGIIITGPNTGGKTVLLKTVGLLALMTKFGLLIPCDKGSTMQIFDQIFCDIGDDQSITSNLSTFSSHMSNIVTIINNITTDSLVLFDEIGAGTDPIEGSSLAVAILNYLLNKNTSFITTTHYSELKVFGFNEPRVINASMEFNENTLSPTYRLLLGVSGSSNAFNIASRMGLSNEIIENAKALLNKNSDATRSMVGKIEKKNMELSLLQKELQFEKMEHLKLKEELNQKINALEKEKKQIIKEAEQDALKIIEKAKTDSKELILKLQELAQKNPKLHELAEAKHQANNLAISNALNKKERPPVDMNHVYHMGDDVYVPSYDQYGNIEKVSGNKFEVSLGNMIIHLKRDQIEPVNASMVKKVYTKKFGTKEIKKTSKTVKMSLDLRGMRYEEAKDAIIQYIDDLVFTRMKQATIIHGFGTGTIRKLVHEILKNNSNIAEYRYGGEGEGGLGVTVITLK